MEKEKFYYIKCYIRIDEEYRPYGYFYDFDWIDFGDKFAKIDVGVVTIEYAKRYKRKCWAEKMIQKIYERTKDNFNLFDDEGNYKYKYEIIEV